MKAIFFDFDYTLGDATEAIVAGFLYGFQQMGLPAPHHWYDSGEWLFHPHWGQ